MKTLFLNPPSFENFDGGASSRWPASREIESYWYPVWLCYPAGLLPGSRVLDAPPHHVTPGETVRIARDYDLVVLFTSTPGFRNDVRLAEAMKSAKPSLRIGFVGPHVTVEPTKSLAHEAIDFVARKEFDYSVVEYAQGKDPSAIAGISFRNGNGQVRHNPDRPQVQDLDALPFVTEIYKRDFQIERYNVPFLKHPFVSFYSSRGCPAQCTFCLWPQTLSGHPWRVRSTDNVVAEVQRCRELFPQLEEIFFDDDTFNYKKSRTLELCAKLKPLGMTWSCTSRVTTDYETLKAMKEAGCRLMIVGYESGDAQILKNIKKGATLEQARRFTRDAHKLGLTIHADFIVGLPGETKETIDRTIAFARELDCETIQVSIGHAYPGTEFHTFLTENSFLTAHSMTDESGHQLPHINYPDLTRADLMEAVERFYGEYYFRPRAVWRVVRKSLTSKKEFLRLAKEAREYLSLRAKRKDFVAAVRAQETPLPPAPPPAEVTEISAN
jgi:hopanoid biosynthesis associated radical SAM protein HpnJ